MLEGRRHEVPCRARGRGRASAPEVLVSRTAVTHWSSRRHAASARARAPAASAARCPAPGRGGGSRARCRRPARRCAAARTGSARHGVSIDWDRRFAPGNGFVCGRNGLLVRTRLLHRRRSASRGLRFHDAHRLQRRLAVLRRLGGDVEQDQRAGFHVLQLQPRGRNRLARPGRSRRPHSARAGGRRRWPARRRAHCGR